MEEKEILLDVRKSLHTIRRVAIFFAVLAMIGLAIGLIDLIIILQSTP